jgi:TonB family protein
VSDPRPPAAPSRRAETRAEPERPAPHRSRLDPDPATHGLALLLACAFSVAFTLALFPPRTHEESFEQAAVRFGYPGPDVFLREIHVRLSNEGVGSRAANRLIGNVRRQKDRATGDRGIPVRPGSRSRGGQGGLSDLAGEAAQSSIGSLRGRRLDLPTVQSEDLVIITLVRPDYPPAAIDQGLEGHVELLALVNVKGEVEDVEIVQSAGHLLDGAATAAVRRCRFEPYRLQGRIQSVYAHFRFNFQLVER